MSRTMNRTHSPAALALAILMAVVLLPRAGRAGGEPEPATATVGAAAGAPAGNPLRDAGLAFESALLAEGAARSAAMEDAARAVEAALNGRLSPEERDAARFLSGEIRFERGDYAGARDDYAGAARDPKRNPYADDAGFASIRALEASGRDKEAAAAWLEWEGRWPQSPLLGEARLAQAWNALRRGDIAAARKTLAALTASRPWTERDPRVALARATELHLSGRHAEALALLAKERDNPAAAYLRGLCHRSAGSLLLAAAEFQRVAEREPASPLRDRALLAKANAFLAARDYRSAAEEFARVVSRVTDDHVRAEAELRAAGAVLLSGAADSALAMLRGVVERRAGTDVAARAQFLIGETLRVQGRCEEAIVELNRVLTTYFQHSVAASAQYRVGRCLDALGRPSDATGTYQAVVSGYPLEAEAPAAAYLAGVGLLGQKRYAAAAPYFQLVLDRYAAADSTKQLPVLTPERRELLDAALCLLQLSYHRAGNLGQLAGAPHVLLHRMPPSRSPWRAYALLIDADASAAQGRYDEARGTLETLTREFPDHPVGASANKLLAWTYARQGRDSLAIAAEERLVARYGGSGDPSIVSGALLDIAHSQFNRKRYREAARAYEEFLRRHPRHAGRLLARHQAALCYVRLNRGGDAVDQWEAIVKDSASAPLAEKAWARAGDLYFQAQRYPDAKRCYLGLLENFSATSGAAIAQLRLAQCEYNAGRDEAAIAAFAEVAARYPGGPAAKEAARGTELALYRLGQRANGTEVLERLVEQHPTSAFAADAQFSIAKRRYQAKEWAAAAEGFRRVVSRFPGYSAADQAQFLLGDALEKAGDRDGARLAQEQFLSYFPQSSLRPTVEFRLGLGQFEAKEYAQAAVAFTRVLAESASVEVRSAARYNLALCTRLLGDVDGARAALESYRSEHPGDARSVDVACQLGDLHEAAGRTADAIREYQAALAANSKPALEAELSFRIGRCRETLGETDAALRAYRQATTAAAYRADPYRLSALARCAAIYEGRRDYGRALDAYRDIAQSSRDREVAQAAAGRASQLESSVPKKKR